MDWGIWLWLADRSAGRTWALLLVRIACLGLELLRRRGESLARCHMA